MKVFISSVIEGLESERDAAASAVRLLQHDVRRSEDFAASSDTPQQACLAGVRWSEVVLLLLGPRYGYRQPSGLSATHEEYREAEGSKPVLAFVQRDVERDGEQEEFIREVQAWTSGVFTNSFTRAEDLRDAIVRALHELELSRRVGPVDEMEMLERARYALKSVRAPERSLVVTVAAGPRQQVIRPSELDDPAFARALQQEALFGEAPIFDPRSGSEPVIRDEVLTIEQDDASVSTNAEGTIRVVSSCFTRTEGVLAGLPALIEEDVRDAIHRALRFASWVLDRVDPTRRLTDVVPVVAVDRGHLGWQTRAEHARSPNSMPFAMSGERLVAELTPAHRHRAVLSHDRTALVDDLTALLRRQGRSRS